MLPEKTEGAEAPKAAARNGKLSCCLLALFIQALLVVGVYLFNASTFKGCCCFKGCC
jgi:hypothetical protein